jgi:hypothetical protein
MDSDIQVFWMLRLEPFKRHRNIGPKGFKLTISPSDNKSRTYKDRSSQSPLFLLCLCGISPDFPNDFENFGMKERLAAAQS